MKMNFNIPSEFTDEDKWFRFFYKKNLIAIIFGAAFTALLYKIGSVVGFLFPLVVFGVIITIVITAITMIPVPETEYLKGGGQTLDIILLRKYIRKKNRVIYVKGYGKDK